MKNKFFILIIFSLVLILPFISSAQNTNFATLYIYCPKDGNADDYKIHLGNSVICRANKNSKYKVKLYEEGKIELWAKTDIWGNSKKSVTIDVKFGKEYFLRCSEIFEHKIDRPQLTLIDTTISRFEDTEYNIVENKTAYFYVRENKAISNTKIDSLNILEFKNKYNPEKIVILKTGKRVHIKLKSILHKDKNFSVRGKLTDITDTSLVINNLYRINFKSVLISDCRFNNQHYKKLPLGIVGVLIIPFGVFFTVLGILEAPNTGIPEEGIGMAIIGGVMIGNAFTKSKHPANVWNVSIKKTRK